MINSQYDSAVIAGEDTLLSETKAWGNGHTELYFSPTYTQNLDLAQYPADRFPEYQAR